MRERWLSIRWVCVLSMLASIAGCSGAQHGRSTDRDGDGIVDARDMCPEMPEDLDGVDDDDGCPDE